MSLRLFALTFTILFSLTAQVWASDPPVIGQTCPNIGVSEMTADQKNIAICLKNDAGNGLVWKSSTASSVPPGTWCGLGSLVYSSRYGRSSGSCSVACNGVCVADSYGGVHCPAGYSALSFNSTSYSYAIGKDGQTQWSDTYYSYTCVKN